MMTREVGFRSGFLIGLAFLLVTINVLASGALAQKLPSFNIDGNTVSVSGVSSGAAMAVQLHVAYSSVFKGAAIIAGTPYWCAMDTLAEAVTACMEDPSLINLDELWGATDLAYAALSIDSPRHLSSSKVWLFSGLNDTIVNTGVVKKARDYYLRYMPANSVTFVNSVNTVHSWVTDKWGNPCLHFGSPYINNCNYDSPGQFLPLFLGSLNPRGTALTTNLFSFDQRYYTPLGISPSNISMGGIGYYYVPTACQGRTQLCKLHVALHGCEQGADIIGKEFVLHTGLNEWAETNNIIVLYPQATISSVEPYNPKGCWDWWGYNEATYATQDGPQIMTIHTMMKALGL